MNALRAVILVVLVIKIKWGPYGKCTFPQNVLGQMQLFRGTLRSWAEVAKNTKSEQRQGERGSRKSRKDTLPKAEEITCKVSGGSLGNTRFWQSKEGRRGRRKIDKDEEGREERIQKEHEAERRERKHEDVLLPINKIQLNKTADMLGLC